MECPVCDEKMLKEDDCYHCGVCGNVENFMKDGWVLQLKDKSQGEMYYDGQDVTSDLSTALVIKDKANYIEFMKKHEEMTFKEFGSDAICNAGYTNMMANFEFVEVEYSI